MRKHIVMLTPLATRMECRGMSGYLKRSMQLAVLGWMAMTLSAQAASFDCRKAGTQIEKFICADAELSKLDEQLSAAYKTALQDEKQADTVKQAQKQWIWGRNGCPTSDCLKKTYQARIHELTGTPVEAETLPQPAQPKEENTGITATKKYPPYPDVWEMHVLLPVFEKTHRPRVSAIQLDSGDIGIGFISEKGERRALDPIRDRNFNWLTFFDRRVTASPIMANGEIRFSDGSVVRPRETIPKYISAAELKDGSYVSSSLGEFWRGCYQGPAANGLVRYQSKVMKKPLQPSKVVLLLLDEPITISTGSVDGPNRPAACDAAEKEVITRVVSLGGEILPLADGGFLLTDEIYGWVIRFDANLNTRSKLLNKKFFIIDGAMGQLSIDEFKFKNYMDENGWTKMQQLSDDLYAYLIKLSKGEK